MGELLRTFQASLFHPSEIYALIKFKLSDTVQLDPSISHTTKDTIRPKGDPKHSWDMCYYYLNKTSRSFARVIAELDEELRHPVCIFYLVLRGLDTIEDDLSIPLDVKLPLLRSFGDVVYRRGWTFDGNAETEKDRMLMVEYDCVIEEFLNLKRPYQLAIADIARRMGNGMADFCSGKQVITMADYNLYTHYVAGLVGLGLTQLFLATNLESAEFPEYLSNNMGLFLQKVNIIKDFLEDLLDGRRFWPQEVWKQYVPQSDMEVGDVGVGRPYTLDVEGPTGDLADFAKAQYRDRAVACLNHLCADALELVPDCLEYMSRLKNKSAFQFCAIPQLMALATITMFFNNPVLFTNTGTKIRRGETVKLILSTHDGFEKLKETYFDYIKRISHKNRNRGSHNPYDTSFTKVSNSIGKIIKWIQLHDMKKGVKEADMVTVKSEKISTNSILAVLILGLALYWGIIGFSFTPVVSQQ